MIGLIKSEGEIVLPQDTNSLTNHQLYYFTTCPYCIKLRLMMWWSGIKMPLKNIQLSREYRDELIAGGGKAQVPCLRIESDHGEVNWMYESDDIIRYLQVRTV